MIDVLDRHAIAVLAVAWCATVFHPVLVAKKLPSHELARLAPHIAIAACASFAATIVYTSLASSTVADAVRNAPAAEQIGAAAGAAAGVLSWMGVFGAVPAIACASAVGAHYTGRTFYSPDSWQHVGLFGGVLAAATVLSTYVVYRYFRQIAEVITTSVCVVSATAVTATCLINGGVARSCVEMHAQTFADLNLWLIGGAAACFHVGAFYLFARPPKPRDRRVEKMQL